MRHATNAGKALLQIAAIGLFVNSASAYGACDMKMHEADAAAEHSMPCHGVADEPVSNLAASDIDTEDCCSACVPVAIFASLVAATEIAADTVVVRSTTIRVSCGFDPPFRPPIAALS